MSEVWKLDRADLAAASAAVPVRSATLAFTPLAARLHRPEPVAEPQSFEPAPVAAAPAIDLEEIEAQAFARGVAEGEARALAALEDEREALIRLSHTLVALQPQPSGELALLLAATVDRLVRQVVGEVEIDALTLLGRARAAAAMIADESVPGKMRLHPDDVARLADADLPVALIADAALAPGTVLLESRDGWIEHGPEVALDRLQTALDNLGLPR